MNYPIAYLELNKFVNTVRGNHRFQLTDDTRLEKDLAITGDEAVEFMAAFFAAFGLDHTGFVCTTYFHRQGLAPFSMTGLLNSLLGTTHPSVPAYDLRIKDLCQVLIASKWVDPVDCPV